MATSAHTVARIATKDTADLNDVSVFVRVIEAGSFTAAARQLGVPKSSASRRVRQREDALGVQLLPRSTRHRPGICVEADRVDLRGPGSVIRVR